MSELKVGDEVTLKRVTGRESNSSFSPLAKHSGNQRLRKMEVRGIEPERRRIRFYNSWWSYRQIGEDVYFYHQLVKYLRVYEK